MARAAAICAQHGCPNAAPCPLHTPKPWADRPPAGKAGYGWAWTATRGKILRRDHATCYLCSELAGEVDHVKPKAEGGTDDESNLRAICKTCHRAKSAQEATRGRQ